MSWPLSEVLAWQSLFDVVGPLDWTRADWLDARRHASQCGRPGDLYRDHLFFKPARRRKTPVEEEIEKYESLLPIAAGLGGPDAVKGIRERIERLEKTKRFYDHTTHLH